MTFRSRVDPLAGIALAVLALSVPASLAGGFAMLTNTAGAVTFFVCAAFLLALLLGLAWPVVYTLGERDLEIRFGLVRMRVRYGEIARVTPTKTLVAGPALSRHRLAISHPGGDVLISPVDPARFLHELAARDADLVADGDQLVRR